MGMGWDGIDRREAHSPLDELRKRFDGGKPAR
jgi:hypothetical protein